jgi:hypothetical protein
VTSAGLGLVAADFEAWWDLILGRFHRDSSSKAESDTNGFPNRNNCVRSGECVSYCGVHPFFKSNSYY